MKTNQTVEDFLKEQTTVTVEIAENMAALASSKWGLDTECYRILDQYEFQSKEPGKSVLLQVLRYDDGKYIDVGTKLMTLAAANKLVRKTYDGPVRLAVASK
jgi:hypothetical protein